MVLAKIGLWYKQMIGMRRSELQKAEAKVVGMIRSATKDNDGQGGKQECENQRFTRKNHVEQQLSTKVDISSEKEVDCAQQETIDLKSKLQPKEAKIEKMKYEHLTREAALTENELLEEEYKKKLDEANKELSLENDLAGM
ncbi:hypothetical protein Zm00014a_032046 [Zea mays]|uniref:Uncharacterized protein n=1 Tax=Zea mays TaxID=4577 RepID=A0A3L6D660_MAIZE|nr:hypothetical protein Zm00014a_032046 [Zea mays]